MAAEGNHPNTYLGQYWDYNNEPHNNSTVLSHWFYLLSIGGYGTNDNNDSYSVSGIGIDDAADIVYRAQTNYLTSSSEYIDARDAMISAAEDIFCVNSPQVKSVTDAWFAVGVGSAYPSTNLTISGDSNICSSNSSFTVNNIPSGASIVWSSSSNITRISSQGSNPCSFTSSGSTSGSGWIKASIANNCSNGISKTKSVWVGKYIPADLRLRDPNTNNPIFTVCYSEPITVKASHDLGYQPDDWDWSVSGSTVSYNTTYNDHSVVTLHPYSYNLVVKIRAHNDCGWSDWADVSPYVTSCNSTYYVVYPNPASSEIYIANKDNSNNRIISGDLKADNSLKIEIYNQSGRSIKFQNLHSENNKFKIDVSQFKKGIYFLKISDLKTKETHEIIIE